MQSVLKHIFFERFQKNKDLVALINKNQKYTYQDLSKKIDELTSSLRIPNQSVVALVSDYSFESIATLFALCIKKCIIIPLGTDQSNHFLQDLQAEFLIQENKISKIQTKYSYPLIKKLIENNTSGLVLFSSGSTGKPKGIVHNLDVMLDIYSQKSFNPTNTAGIFLPDHIAGIDVIFSQFAIGGTLSIPSNRTPKDICKLIENYKVEILPTSPTFLRLLLLSDLIQNYNLSSLKLVIYGSEAMPEVLLTNLKTTLPNVRFKQSFGTSETGVIQTKNSKNTEGFIWLDPLYTQYKIINNELYLKSKTQTLGYLNDNNIAFEYGWFKTGDKVETLIENDKEYIKIIGRTKEIINVGGEKVLPQEIENIVLQIQGVKDCLVYGEKNSITGQSITLEVVVDTNILNADKLELKKVIRSYCKDRLVNYKIPTKVIAVDSLVMSERFKKIRKSTTTKIFENT